MANATGIATIDFGSFPGSNVATLTITGQTGISSTSKAEAFFMSGDTTADHTSNDHLYAALLVSLVCGVPTPGDGFVITALCAEYMQGTFKIRWVWAD